MAAARSNGALSVFTKLLVAVLLATGLELINFLLLYHGYLSGSWFVALYFPIMLGLSIFGIMLYFSTTGPVWKRCVIAMAGGLTMTFFWLLAFALISGRITHLTDVAVVNGS